MINTPLGPSRSTRLPHKEGEDSRQRLLTAGLTLFAQQGFSKTSTRELAEAAGVNVAAISYYFGDKAGLYRAVFSEPLDTGGDVARFSDPTLPLADALRGFYAAFLEPLRDGEAARLCLKLHFREMLEPTGLWDEEINHNIKPMHEALVALLCRELGLVQPDDDVLRLAICLAGLGVHVHLGHDVTDQLAPTLNAGTDAIDRWGASLVLFGQAMVDAERRRRAAGQEKP